MSSQVLGKLSKVLQESGPLAVALSGGVDSRLLCHVALLSGCDVLAVHVSGVHLSSAETECAVQWARRHKVKLIVTEYNPLQWLDVAQNNRQRCYSCKRGLFQHVVQVLAQAGEAHRKICDGTHADDQSVFRPGRRALLEAGVFSPLAWVGLRKADIYALAQASGLDNPRQKARPCLLTRLAYDLAPDAQMLARVAAAEQEIESYLAEKQIDCDFRLRLQPEAVLQITVLPDVFRVCVREIMTKYGFKPCKVCVSERISGFWDLPQEELEQMLASAQLL